MTRAVNARLAGFTALLYAAMRTAQSVTAERLTVVLTFATIIAAIVLAVTLYALTRDVNREVAVLALSCRIFEGVLNGIATIVLIALLWLATTDAAAANVVGALLLKSRAWSEFAAATVFAIGTTLYAYLFLRSRSIPAMLAWLGVLSSALLVIGLPLEFTHVLHGAAASLVRVPATVFEVSFGVWLLAKGVA